MAHGGALDTAVKVAPPLMGLTVAELLPPVQLIAYTLTAVYTALMIGHFVWTKLIRPRL